jgi:hypothetical protein
VERASAKTYQIVDKMKLPNAVDEAVLDPVSKYFYVESGSAEPGGKTHLVNIIDTYLCGKGQRSKVSASHKATTAC